VRSHFRELLGSGLEADGLLERARQQAEHPMNVFDGVFCLAGEVGGDSHAHPPEISWRIEHLVPALEALEAPEAPEAPEPCRAWR
jgi:hypothetical protein